MLGTGLLKQITDLSKIIKEKMLNRVLPKDDANPPAATGSVSIFLQLKRCKNQL